MDVTPEEIRRQSIAFKNYYLAYVDLKFKECLDNGGKPNELPENKTDEQLYQEFVDKKPVSL